IDRSRHFLPHRRVLFNLLAYRFQWHLRSEKTVRQRLVLAQQTEKQMLTLDIRRPKLTRFIPRKKDHPPRLLCIAFKHGCSPKRSTSHSSPQIRGEDATGKTRR